MRPYITDDEAAEKWCPHSRIATPVVTLHSGHVITAIAANRSSKTAKSANLKAETCPESARCIGSGCMAWDYEVVTYDLPGADPFSIRKPTRQTGKGRCGAFPEPSK